MSTRRLPARLAYVKAAATPAVRKFSGSRQHARQSLTTRQRQVNYLLGSRTHVMRTS